MRVVPIQCFDIGSRSGAREPGVPGEVTQAHADPTVARKPNILIVMCDQKRYPQWTPDLPTPAAERGGAIPSALEAAPPQLSVVKAQVLWSHVYHRK